MSKADEPCWCPGCDRDVPPAEMYSLNGYNHEVCRTCWNGMRPFERIVLRMLATTGFDSSEDGGGLGIGFELNELLELGRKFFRASHGHDAHNACPECDPDGYRRSQELRRKAQARKQQTPPPSAG